MPRPTHALAALLLVSLGGCNPFAPESHTRRTLVIEHHAEECTGFWLQLCLLTRAPGESELLRHYGGIEGFQFQWGYTSEVQVEDRPVPNPPADGSSVRTVLVRVASRERVPEGTEFGMFLTSGEGRVVEVEPNRYRFYDSAEFTCGEGLDCSALREQILAGNRMRYRFRHPAAPELPLTLVSWEMCDPTMIGSGECSR